MKRQNTPAPRLNPRRMAAAVARQNFSRLIDDVRTEEEPVIIEKGGVPVAAVVPLAVLERDRLWAQERADRVALLERLRAPFLAFPAEDLEAKVAQAIKAGRRQRKRRPSRP